MLINEELEAFFQNLIVKIKKYPYFSEDINIQMAKWARSPTNAFQPIGFKETWYTILESEIAILA